MRWMLAAAVSVAVALGLAAATAGTAAASPDDTLTEPFPIIELDDHGWPVDLTGQPVFLPPPPVDPAPGPRHLPPVTDGI